MKYSGVAYLVFEYYIQNEYGVRERTMTKRKVYVDVSSVSSTEWFEGSRNGLNPQYRFTMFNFDYHSEKIIEFNDIQYSIYRTFNKSVNEIELYTEFRKGNEEFVEPDDGEESES